MCHMKLEDMNMVNNYSGRLGLRVCIKVMKTTNNECMKKYIIYTNMWDLSLSMFLCVLG